jgi:hypothetical protein
VGPHSRNGVGRRVRRLVVGGLVGSLLAGLVLVTGGGTASAVPDPNLQQVASEQDYEVMYGPFPAYAPPGTSWGAVSRSNVAVFGHKGYFQGYSWRVVAGSWTRVCAQAWTPIFGGGWYNLGCGQSGGGSLLWGDIVAVPKMRFRSATLTGGAVTWSH